MKRMIWFALLAFGAMAIFGHAKPVFLLWRGGGKGVATAGGVFFALSPFVVIIATAFSTIFFALMDQFWLWVTKHVYGS